MWKDIPANTKHLHNICKTSAERIRRWSNIVQMLYKCFFITGLKLDMKSVNPLLDKSSYLNFNRLEVVDRGSETQLQVG